MLFSAPMVNALLAGLKTQTRRLKGGPPALGTRIWVRENFRLTSDQDPQPPRWGLGACRYEAERPAAADPTSWGKLRPAIFMPRRLSRLTLTVTDVRTEPLQQISFADAEAEGLELKDRWRWPAPLDDESFANPRDAYRWLWTRINGEPSWLADPTVIVISFEVGRRNIDD